MQEKLSAAPRHAGVSVPVLHAGNPRRTGRRSPGRAPVLFREYSPDRCEPAIPPRTTPNKRSRGPWELPDCTSGTNYGRSPLWEGYAGRPNRRAWFSWYSSVWLRNSDVQKIAKKEHDGAGTHLSLR